MRQSARFSELPAGAKFWLESDGSFWWKKVECKGARAGEAYCNAKHNYIRQYFPPDRTVWVERSSSELH
jgi:hypothetical protein